MEQLKRYQAQPSIYEVSYDDPNLTSEMALNSMKDQLDNATEVNEETKLSMKDLRKQARENGK